MSISIQLGFSDTIWLVEVQSIIETKIQDLDAKSLDNDPVVLQGRISDALKKIDEYRQDPAPYGQRDSLEEEEFLDNLEKTLKGNFQNIAQDARNLKESLELTELKETLEEILALLGRGKAVSVSKEVYSKLDKFWVNTLKDTENEIHTPNF